MAADVKRSSDAMSGLAKYVAIINGIQQKFTEQFE